MVSKKSKRKTARKAKVNYTTKTGPANWMRTEKDVSDSLSITTGMYKHEKKKQVAKGRGKPGQKLFTRPDMVKKVKPTHPKKTKSKKK